MYLLDSNICIDFMRGKLPLAYRRFQESDPHMFAIPAVVEAELLYGAEHSKHPEKNRAVVEAFLTPFRIVPFDDPAARIYATIRADLASKGMPIGPNDLLIAATALSVGGVLVTNNVGEFKRVPNLRVESWGEADW